MVSTRTRSLRAGRLLASRVLIFTSLGLSVLAGLSSLASAQARPNPPMAKRVPKTTTLHGVTLTDEYGWLREKGTPEVTAYLEAENAYTEAGTAHTAALRETLYNELLGRIKESDQDVPARDGGYWYYTRTEEGKAYPVFCRKKGTLEAAEEVYLDQNALADGKKFHALGGMDVSPDGTTLLYLEDLTAFREYTLHVKDLSTGRILESISDVWNGTAWADDNRTFFYTRADAAKRGNTIWRHVLGTPRDADVKVFEEPNVLYDAGVFEIAQRCVHLHCLRRVHLLGVARHPHGGAHDGTARRRAAPAGRRVPRRARRRVFLSADERRRPKLPHPPRRRSRGRPARMDGLGAAP